MLTTSRLHLRELCQEDWYTIAAYSADPQVREFQLKGQGQPAAIEQLVTYAVTQAQSVPRQAYMLGITRQDDPTLLGLCTLVVSLADPRRAFIGWELNRCFWGNGYATEAASALMNYAFRNLKLQRVIGNCFAANTASVRIMVKLDMQRSRNPIETWLLLRRYRESRPIVYYFINKRDWERKKAQEVQGRFSF